jgi:hypothetical protein
MIAMYRRVSLEIWVVMHRIHTHFDVDNYRVREWDQQSRSNDINLIHSSSAMTCHFVTIIIANSADDVSSESNSLP